MLAGCIVYAISPVSQIDRFNDLVFDSYQRILPRAATDNPIAIVDIDEGSLARLGQWPWPRTIIAKIVDNLGQLGAAAIVFDIVFSEPDRTSPHRIIPQLLRKGVDLKILDESKVFNTDKLFSETIARHPVITGLAMTPFNKNIPPNAKSSFNFIGPADVSYLPQYSGSISNIPMLDSGAKGIGVFSFNPASDGLVRRIPLFSRSGKILLPTLSIEALRVAQGVPSISIKSTGASGELDTGNPAMVAIKVGSFKIPVEPDGFTRVYYTKNSNFTTIAAHRLTYENPDQRLAEKIAGHIVFVGTSAIGLRDIVATPMQAVMPGVVVHAELTDQIMSGTYLSRPDWSFGLELSAAIILPLIILAGLPWFRPLSAGLLSLLVIMSIFVFCWMAFREYRLLLSPLLPASVSFLVFGGASAARLFLTENEGRFIRNAFGQYIAPALVEQLAHDPSQLILGGQTRTISVLFTDVRGFTAISESMKDDPQGLTRLINKLLTPLSNAIVGRKGTIDKYMGDAIMAFWNAPLDDEQHAENACMAAIAMIEEVALLNEELQEAARITGTEQIELSIGIGINTGTSVVGNMGTDMRFDYTALGDTVNLASRLEGQSKTYGIPTIIGEVTATNTGEMVATLEVDLIRVKGKKEPERIFALMGGKDLAMDKDFIALKALNRSMLASYRTQDWASAYEAVELCAKLAERMKFDLEEYLFLYESRISEFRANPPGQNWTGIYTATSK